MVLSSCIGIGGVCERERRKKGEGRSGAKEQRQETRRGRLRHGIGIEFTLDGQGASSDGSQR
jgi:hypothetical protein